MIEGLLAFAVLMFWALRRDLLAVGAAVLFWGLR